MDRRARRTRQALRQAFLEVAQERGLMAASVQEITERANVSRGTFYAHYADKYALIEAVVREGFQNMLSTFELTSETEKKTLHQLTRAILEYIRRTQHHRLASDIALLVEQVIHEELNQLLLFWLKQNQVKDIWVRVPQETLAQIIGWAIFGAAIQWSRETTTISSDQMAHDILQAFSEVVQLASIDPLR